MDPQAFELLFQAEYAHVRNYVGRRLGTSEAEDITCAIFEIALRRRESFDPEIANARSWLFGIANNTVRNYRRAERRRMRLIARFGGLTDRSLDFSEDAGDRVDAERRSGQLAAALDSLPRNQREILLLVAWAGLAPIEAAKALQVKPETARSRLSKARSILRERLSDREQELREARIDLGADHAEASDWNSG